MAMDNIKKALSVKEKMMNILKFEVSEEKKYYDGLKDTKEYHLLVATLIATVTFTTAFTIPGGFHSEEGSDQGTAILNKHLAFRMFIITDTIGMTLSLSAVFVHFIMSFQKFQRHESLLTVALWLTIVAMGTVVVAFVTGLYAVLAPSFWLAIATSCIALSFFLLVLCALIVLYRGVFLRWLRAIRKLRLEEAGSGNLPPTHFKKEN